MIGDFSQIDIYLVCLFISGPLAAVLIAVLVACFYTRWDTRQPREISTLHRPPNTSNVQETVPVPAGGTKPPRQRLGSPKAAFDTSMDTDVSYNSMPATASDSLPMVGGPENRERTSTFGYIGKVNVSSPHHDREQLNRLARVAQASARIRANSQANKPPLPGSGAPALPPSNAKSTSHQNQNHMPRQQQQQQQLASPSYARTNRPLFFTGASMTSDIVSPTAPLASGQPDHSDIYDMTEHDSPPRDAPPPPMEDIYDTTA